MVKAAIDTSKYSRCGLFYNIDPGEKLSSFTHEEFARFKGQCKLPAVFLAEFIESGPELIAELLNIGLDVTLLIGNLKAAAKIYKFQLPEVRSSFIL